VSGIDKIPYAGQPLDASGSGQQRMATADSRRNQGHTLAYLSPSGTPLAWTGDDQAPFVRVLQEVPGLVSVSVIPTEETTSDGVLVCALCPAALHELWANDSRADRSVARWIQFFDRTDAPSAGMQPAVAAIRLCTQTYVGYIDVPLGFVTGIVVAISSTANIYTAIAPADDFAITARVLGT
jgi:hypothetical protein